jgi:enterochelin esterase family protein
MGGFGAVLYAFERPDTFSAAISLSGSLFLHNLAEDRGRRRRLAQLFGGVYGVPFSITRFNAWTVFARLDKVAGLPRPPAVWLSAGDDDFPAIVDGTVRLHLALRRRGVVTQLRIDDAGHTWAYWRKAIVPALEWLSPRLEGRCDVVAGDR